MPKLIYILNHYSKNSSSHFFHVMNLLEEMAERGISISLIIEKSIDLPKISSGNIQIYPIQTSKWFRPFVLMSLLFHLKKKAYQKIFVRINWRAALIAVIVGIFTKQKTYFWLSSQGNKEHYDSCPNGFRKTLLWIRTQLPYYLLRKGIYRLVTGPESMVNYYLEQYGFKREKTIVLYNDIDLKRFHPVNTIEKSKLRKELKIPVESFIILFVHRFSPVRKTGYYLPYILDRFFEAEQLKPVTFIFIGGGPEQTKLEEALLRKKYKEYIHFTDAIPNAQIDLYYKAADLFIQPTFAEGFPRTMLEAMACGLPVVSTDAGGIQDILGPQQSTFMVNKEDRDAFLIKMNQLINDPLAMEQCRQENLIESSKYDTKIIANMYIEKLFTK